MTADELVAELTPAAPLVVNRVLHGLRGRGVTPAIDHEDLEQVALEALVRAAGVLDLTRTDNPRAFLLGRMKNGVIDYLRVHGPRGRYERQDGTYKDRTAVSLDAPLGDDLTRLDRLPAEPDHIPGLDVDRETLAKALAALEQRELAVVTRYFRHKTQEEIAAELGVSNARVSQIETAALRKLRARLDEVSEPEEPEPEEPEPAPPARLSANELAALRLAADGLSAEASASILAVPLETIKSRRKNVIRKLGAANMQHAIALAFRSGALE